MDVGLTKIRLLSYKSQNFITHSHGSEKECFKGNEASQWKRPKFDPSPHQNQLTDLHKKMAGVDSTRHAKFCGDRFGGFCSPNTWSCRARILVRPTSILLLQRNGHEMPCTAKSRIWGAETPGTDRHKILHAACYPGRNHACHFLWRSVNYFGVARGRILAFSIDLLRRL